jgi:hypothetical protein
MTQSAFLPNLPGRPEDVEGRLLDLGAMAGAPGEKMVTATIEMPPGAKAGQTLKAMVNVAEGEMGAVMVKLPAGCAPGQKLTFTVPLSTVSRHVHSSGETGTQRYRMDRHLSEARNRHVFSLLPPAFSGHPAKRVCHVSPLPPPFSGHPAKRMCLIASPYSFLSEASRPSVARGVV